MKRALKWIAVLLVVFGLLVVAAIVTFPRWFGIALGAAGDRFGVTIGKYERLDHGRFALRDVTRTNDVFDLRISRLEGYLPYDWYRAAKATNHTNPFMEVDGWRVVLHPQSDRTSSVPATNRLAVFDLWQKVERYLAQAREWMPKATLLNGTVEYRGRAYTFPVVTWDEGKLDAGGVWPANAVPFEIKGKLSGETPYQLSFLMTPLDLRARLQVAETNGLLNTRATLFYKDNRADVNADFAEHDVLPTRATLKAPNLKIPADLIHLNGYDELTGALNGSWETNHYSLQLTAHADPLASSKFPQTEIQLVASGDTNTVKIERLLSTAPGLQLSLSDPIELTYQGRLLSERSELKIAADLEKLPWLNAKGEFEGTLLLKRGEKFPIATIRAGGRKVQAYNIELNELSLAGTIDWPKLEGIELKARLGTNGFLNLAGSANIEKRELGATTLALDVPPGSVPTNFLPAGVGFSGATLKAELSGNLSNLTHGAEFEVRDFTTAQTQPLRVQGNWKAQQLTFSDLVLRATAGPAVFYAEGRGFSEGERTNLVLRALSLKTGDQTLLELQGPATVSLLPEKRVELTSLRLTGPQRQLMLAGSTAWPRSGDLEVNGTNINPTLFQSFVRRSLSGFDLAQLSASLHWSNSPLRGGIAGRVSVRQERFDRIQAEIDLQLQPGEVIFKKLDISNPTGAMASAQGSVPLSINVAGGPRVEISPTNSFDFHLTTSTNEALWQTVGKMAHLGLTNVAVDLSLQGTPNRPRAVLRASAAAVQLIRTNQEVPPLGPIDANLVLNERFLRIREFSLHSLGQRAVADGQVILGTNFWSLPREQIVPYVLDHANLRIEAPDVKLAPFTAYLPKYLSPQGELNLQLAVKPGTDLDGRIQVRRVETRPLPNIGVVQSIRADLLLKGRQVQFQELSGVLGGERMRLTGQVDLSPESVAKGYPDLDLAITGDNLPLARNPDVILRSDLDLRVRNGSNQVPVITGTANLRDSFLLRDISTLVPGRVSRPERRPPYFSIEQDPIDEWKLDVRVQGERFMRVRSPFFQGVVTANFHVVGTAVEPMALGEANISSGMIIFPFATLEVRQALVSLTTEDPYLPHVFAIAEGRAFGFDIRMQAEGPANEPIIEFSSVPALSSEQIVLMLTTGQIPREDFSFSNRDRVGKLALFVGKSLLQKLRPGKSGEEKLTIRSGQDITEQGRQTYEVEYRLSPRWALVGEYDRFGALNANVKWRLISR